ncbi:MAG: histone deacetylase family protein [Phycisphaeraceae bacterium]|nr:histone deacetylase family protein [Phycisphaeraceae bacterium]
MFRIRQVNEAWLPVHERDIERVQAILRERLPGISEEEVSGLPHRLRDPLKHRLRAILLVADDLRGKMRGFALMSHAPDEGFCLLDYIATGKSSVSGGTGAALYQRVRDVAKSLGAFGLFFECLPDDPAACSNPELAQQNASRLRFYERFGARPIVGTAYESPVREGDSDLPHLVFDSLGEGEPLSRDRARRVVRAFLERKYSSLCPPEYVQRVVDSFRDDPVRLREPRYAKRATAPKPVRTGERLIALVVNDKHEIHHVRERGYVEAPVRVKSILDGILPTGLFWTAEPREFPESHILAVHDRALVEYLKRVSAAVEPGRSIYPYVFPIRNRSKPPKDRAYAAGYFCIDTFTPLNRNAYVAAKRAVDCALTCAAMLLDGQRLAYALVRPPGHHAERDVFGGFCYFCNAAVAAEMLSKHGRVAILDVDYHHGNGQQEIFYQRGDVLTVSIHAHPDVAYPFFTGFEEETGSDDGLGANLNIALPEQLRTGQYRAALERALTRIAAHNPAFLVIALGLDTGKGDPTGTWSLSPDDFRANGELIGRLGFPILVVQEGGYRTLTLGANARAFFLGLAAGAFA